MIEIKEQTLDRIHELLAGVEDAERRVLKPALARGLTAGKTAAGKSVRETYRISAGDFRNQGRLTLNAVSESGNDIIGSLEFSGGSIPLMKFKVAPKVPKRGKAPSAAVLMANGMVKLSRQKNIFVAQMDSGHYGIFERIDGKYAEGRAGEENKQNKHTQAIRQLLSLSTAQMVGNPNVMQIMEARVQEVINQRIDHEIDRLLDEYGG